MKNAVEPIMELTPIVFVVIVEPIRLLYLKSDAWPTAIVILDALRVEAEKVLKVISLIVVMLLADMLLTDIVEAERVSVWILLACKARVLAVEPIMLEYCIVDVVIVEAVRVLTDTSLKLGELVQSSLPFVETDNM
jgi:hypothetical protein